MASNERKSLLRRNTAPVYGSAGESVPLKEHRRVHTARTQGSEGSGQRIFMDSQLANPSPGRKFDEGKLQRILNEYGRRSPGEQVKLFEVYFDGAFKTWAHMPRRQVERMFFDDFQLSERRVISLSDLFVELGGDDVGSDYKSHFNSIVLYLAKHHYAYILCREVVEGTLKLKTKDFIDRLLFWITRPSRKLVFYSLHVDFLNTEIAKIERRDQRRRFVPPSSSPDLSGASKKQRPRRESDELVSHKLRQRGTSSSEGGNAASDSDDNEEGADGELAKLQTDYFYIIGSERSSSLQGSETKEKPQDRIRQTARPTIPPLSLDKLGQKTKKKH